MRCILFILTCIFFPRFECRSEPTDSYFVTRIDTEEAICIAPRDGDYYPFPTFDLDKLQIPSDVGIMDWNWLSDWQLQNDTNVQPAGPSKVLIAGNQQFQFVARDNRGTTYVIILAANVTLWVVDDFKPRGAGMLFELDHFNETTKLKDTTLKYCDKNPEDEGANCTTVDFKSGTNHLYDGNRWTVFKIKLKENRTGVEMVERSPIKLNENRTGVEIFESSYSFEKTVVQWTWNNTNISNPFSSQKDYAMFAKSHQRNAALYYYGHDGHYRLDLANNREMKRNYTTKRSSGNFCVQVAWNIERRSDDSNELLQVKNLASNQVQPAANATHDKHLQRTLFQWNHLDAGEYQFTLRFDKRQPQYLELCQDYDDQSKIVKTWTSMPKAITKCQFRVGHPEEYSAGPSSPRDSTIKPKWTLEEWAYVCDRLGIGSNDTEVQIKFCNLNGCNFSKCPHLQD